MTTDTLAATAVSELRERFGDAIVSAADDGYDLARGAFNILIDQRPEAVAYPSSVTETAAIVSAARDAGLKIAPRGSGHNVGPLGSLENTLVIRFDRMTGVEIDVEARSARVEAGARWWDVTPKASEHGLAALHGSSPEINVVGYSLGGGMGWLARKHGLQANRLTAIELVTADGEIRIVDAESDPDLFWALRGGGANFGVVTSVEFELIELAELYAGAMFFPYERAAEVMKAWRQWTADAPEEVTSVVRVLQFPPLEIVPEVVRGKSFTIVEAAFLGTEDAGRELTAPLRELGPVMDTFAMVAPMALAELHMDPVDPVPYRAIHSLLGDLSDELIDESLAVAGPGAGSPLSFEIRHTGGAMSRTEPGAGAISTIPGEYLMFGLGPVMDPAMVPTIEAELARLEAVFAPHEAGRYLNFSEEPTDPAVQFGAETVARLAAIRAIHDPKGLFRANHAV